MIDGKDKFSFIKTVGQKILDPNYGLWMEPSVMFLVILFCFSNLQKLVTNNETPIHVFQTTSSG